MPEKKKTNQSNWMLIHFHFKVGYWNIGSGRGCQSCGCDETGALNATCHPVTGMCSCRPGVGGQNCDRCLPGFFGFSATGCQECEPCNKPGHICDPDTGRCVCPPFTEGPQCKTCSAGAWSYHPVKGCKVPTLMFTFSSSCRSVGN